VRATYGGLQLALGAFFVWASRDPARFRIALMLATIIFVCLAGSRLVGLLVDQQATFPMVAATAIEAAWAVVSAAFLSKQPA
jgi:hypothetical protein